MASTSIYRTMGTATNRNIFTLSMWVKMSKTGSDLSAYQFCDFYVSADIRISIYHDPNDHLNCYMKGGGYDGNIFVTNAKYRDTSAWYHFVWRFDTTQATASDRVRLYVNGELATFSSTNYPSQNFNLQQGTSSYQQFIGKYGANTDNNFEGLMSHIHFCDGQSYAPTVFGETDSTTGEWKIKTDVTATYGNNGFFILKDGNSVTDHSGNGLSFSTAGTLTKTEDCPSNVFATGNNLATYWTAATFANGNTTQTTQSNNYAFNTSTLGFKTGKFYWEAKIVSSAQSDMFGITGRTNAGATTHELGKYSDQYAFNSYSGVSRNNSTDTSYASQFNSNGTIVQIAVDMTNLKIHLGVNGVWQNSSNPSNNTGGLAIGAISTTTDGYYFVGIGDYSNGAGTYSYNFGNGYFGTTAVSSAGTNASGNGIFEYDTPTGYTALSTKGLNQ